jgi:hypothetical protein
VRGPKTPALITTTSKAAPSTCQAGLDALAAMPWPLFQPPEVKTYRVGAEAVTVRQVLVQDPDGYLLRFAEEVRPDAA